MEFQYQESTCAIPRMTFFQEWVKAPCKNVKNKSLFIYISSNFDLEDITEESLRELKIKISRISNKIAEKWASCGKSEDKFIKKYSDWLGGEDFNFYFIKNVPQPSSSSTSVGRPKKSFEEASFRTKRRRVVDLVNSRSLPELTTAAEVSLRKSGQKNVANIVKDIVADPSKAGRIKKLESMNRGRMLNNDEALAYYVDSKSSTHTYKQTRKWSLKAGHAVFPSYKNVLKSKMACLPLSNDISVTEIRAEIKLQAILDLTVSRLVKVQENVIANVLPTSTSFTLISKWGCDGSSGHSNYKQKFTNTEFSDEYLFVFNFVPIQLISKSSDIVWQNPRTSSTMYCRPIKFIFSKETTEFTVSETEMIKNEIDTLKPTLCNIGDFVITVSHNLLLTMVDGKVCNALTETRSSQKCYICGATPKSMNEESLHYVSNPEHFSFGLSTLHAYIRSFECLLHISYKLEIKKWQAKDEQDKLNIKFRTEMIQREFKNRMGLIVDKPKPGFGNSNDGNTARRFFKNPELSAEITGLDLQLIKNIGFVLAALASGYKINLENFKKLTEETRKLYISLYSWYYMPCTLHKILVHGAEIIQHALLPIGQLSEEAQEARNKDCRRFRECNTRKNSRIATNTDLLNMLLITSDPVINSYRETPKKRSGTFPQEVLNLLEAPTVTTVQTSDIDEELQNISLSSSSSEETNESDEEIDL